MPSSLPIRVSHRSKTSCGAAVKATESTVAFDATGGGNVEVSVKACAEELKDLEDATQVLGSETGTAEGHTVFVVPDGPLHLVCTRR